MRRAVLERAPGDEPGGGKLLQRRSNARLSHRGAISLVQRGQHGNPGSLRRQMRQHADHRLGLGAGRGVAPGRRDDVVECDGERGPHAAAILAVRCSLVRLVAPELGEPFAVGGERYPPVAATFAGGMCQCQWQPAELLGESRRLRLVLLAGALGGLG